MLEQILFLIIGPLAVWRLTNLIVDDSEDGPWGLLHRVRYWLGVRYDEKNRGYGKHELGKIFICMWCASLWVGLIVALLAVDLFSWRLLVLLPLYLSAGALLVNKWVKR